jgi:hypothetical protein
MPLNRVVKHAQRLMRCYAKCLQEATYTWEQPWQEEDRLATYFFWTSRASEFYAKHGALLYTQLEKMVGGRYV